MSKLFFRVESKTDKSDESEVFNMGFYRISNEQGDRLYEIVGLNNNDDFRHPLPDEDTKLKHYWDSLDYKQQWEHFFGFSSFEQLKRWFYRDSWLSDLDNYLVISVYSVNELHEGYTQAICKDENVISKLVEFPVTVTESDVLKEFKGIWL
ncbi:hypothetical protein VP14_166 [Vibrio phage VPMCC14]|nr:hypothetical protein VP14_166 [Vibrio phage VPMCC14]